MKCTLYLLSILFLLSCNPDIIEENQEEEKQENNLIDWEEDPNDYEVTPGEIL